MAQMPQFVENQKNRIFKVRDSFEKEGVPVRFLYVPSEDNPADSGTRGVDASQIHSLPWLRGPQWLSLESFPKRLKVMNDSPREESYEALEDTEKSTTTVIVATSDQREVNDLIDLSRFSRWSTALRVTARVGKLVRSWVGKVNERRQHEIQLSFVKKFSDDQEITAQDIALSETILIRDAHKGLSLRDLKKRFPQKKIIRDHDGIIRNESRLQNAMIPFDTKNPIFIDKHSNLARLILTDIHYKNGHSGKNHTLCLARQRFWIPRPSSTFKHYLKTCVVCKKAHGLPFGAPEMPPLPKDRVVLKTPFETTGCDYLGPFQTKENQKCYVCLYTCLTTRAIHLETVENMTAGAFLGSFIRFISRRGVPKLIRSDCGTNFKLGHRVIEIMFETACNESGASVMSYCADNGIQWLFNPPGAPWMGGAWKRLVGTVRRAFTKSVGRKKLSYFELQTIVTQIEAIVNTRPLTALTEDVDELPIRPVDFLQRSLKYSLHPLNDQEYQDPSFDPECIQSVSQAKQALESADKVTAKFWEKWHVDYLTSLREIQVIGRKQPRHTKLREPRVNEIVLVEQENLPRGCWCYGKVTELVRGNDGLVRSVKVLMPNRHVWHRPLIKIYPLEISSEVDTKPRSSDSQEIGENLPEPELTNRFAPSTPRQAKIKAKNLIAKTTGILNVLSLSMTPCTLAMTLVTALLITSVQGSEHTPLLTCQEGFLDVTPPATIFELCIRNSCKTFPPTTKALRFELPFTSRNTSIATSMRYSSKNGSTFLETACLLPHICEFSQTIMSKILIANPHCWPIGAFASVATLVYMIVTIPFLTCKILRNCKAPNRHVSGSTDPEIHRGTVRQRQNLAKHCDHDICSNDGTNIQLQNFKPMRIFQTKSSLAITVACAITLSVSTCQQSYTKHNTELTCTSKGKCSLEFNRELLYNNINHLNCISVLHGNKTVGTITVERLPVEMQCSKQTLFFTRDTQINIYSATRCALMGSCTGNFCAEISSNSVVQELISASQYPGYTGCEPSCGGLACGCLLPFPSCSFYRITHVPKTEDVYEILRCLEWKAIIRLKIRIVFPHAISQGVLTLQPYVPKKFHDMLFTVISMAKPASPLMSHKFAMKESETLIIPEHYQIPVECPTFDMASKNFSQCHNAVICDCDVKASPARCNCPDNTIEYIRTDISNVFPIRTPFLKLVSNKEYISVISSREEMIVSVQSKSLKESAKYVGEQQCRISATDLNGCYSCQEGAAIKFTCYTHTPTWIVIRCGSHVFSIECDRSGEKTTIYLDFQKAVVSQECSYECDGRSKRLQLQGVLAYLPNVDDHIVLDSHEHSWKTKSSRLHNGWNLPDLTPLIHAMKNHWRAAVAISGTTTILIIATYFMGPTVLVFLIQIMAKFLFQMSSSAVLAIVTLTQRIFSLCRRIYGGFPTM